MKQYECDRLCVLNTLGSYIISRVITHIEQGVSRLGYVFALTYMENLLTSSSTVEYSCENTWDFNI